MLLSGIRVLDLTRITLGPWCTRLLAAFGAEIIRIESETSLDLNRSLGPIIEKKKGALFIENNPGKLSARLNLKTNQGKDIFYQLVSKSDILVENFSASVPAKLKIDWPILREINPRLIYASLTSMGKSGPYKDYIGYGPGIQRMAGLSAISGYPDGLPMGTGMSFPDYAPAIHCGIGIICALREREKNGVGGYLEVSMFESTASFLGLEILKFQALGEVNSRCGNSLPWAVPHSCYPCCGEDEWCVITVFTEEQWNGLCKAMSEPAWPKGMESLATRKEKEALINNKLSDWTRTYACEELISLLRRFGVPCQKVNNAKDILADNYFQQLGFFQKDDTYLYDKVPIWLNGCSPEFKKGPPSLGENDSYVFSGLLGLSAAEIKDLRDRQVIW